MNWGLTCVLMEFIENIIIALTQLLKKCFIGIFWWLSTGYSCRVHSLRNPTSPNPWYQRHIYSCHVFSLRNPTSPNPWYQRHIYSCHVFSLRNPTSPNPWYQRLTGVRANYLRIVAINVSDWRLINGDGSPGTLISGTPVEKMGGQWSLAAYHRSILMYSVLCQFYLRSVHDMWGHVQPLGIFIEKKFLSWSEFYCFCPSF